MTGERWYIAGPMRGIPRFNFPAFMEAADALEERPIWNAGVVWNPARRDLDNGFDPSRATTGREDAARLMGEDVFREAVAWGMAKAAECTDILLLPGWEKSEGARLELGIAEMMGSRVWVYSGGDIREATDDDLPPLAPEFAKAEPNEERVVSRTGGAKGRKDAELGWIDPLALTELARVAGHGARKYGDGRNYMKGFDWDLSYNALQRHAMAFWAGEDLNDTGLGHMAHAAWHCLVLETFRQRGIGSDTRFKGEE